MVNQIGIEARAIGPHEQLTFPLGYGGPSRGVLSFPTTEQLEWAPDADQQYQSYPRATLCKNYENVTAVNLSGHVVHLHTTYGLHLSSAVAHTYTKNEEPLPLA